MAWSFDGDDDESFDQREGAPGGHASMMPLLDIFFEIASQCHL